MQIQPVFTKKHSCDLKSQAHSKPYVNMQLSPLFSSSFHGSCHRWYISKTILHLTAGEDEPSMMICYFCYNVSDYLTQSMFNTCQNQSHKTLKSKSFSQEESYSIRQSLVLFIFQQDMAFLLTNVLNATATGKTHFFFLYNRYEVRNTSHICYSRLSADSWKNTASQHGKMFFPNNLK